MIEHLLSPSAAQTRQKFKEAYDLHLAATIERAEKQLILARHGRRLLSLLDDATVVPGENRASYEGEDQARHILEEAEVELKSWEPRMEPISSSQRRGEVHDSGVEGDMGSEQEYEHESQERVGVEIST